MGSHEETAWAPSSNVFWRSYQGLHNILPPRSLINFWISCQSPVALRQAWHLRLSGPLFFYQVCYGNCHARAKCPTSIPICWALSSSTAYTFVEQTHCPLCRVLWIFMNNYFFCCCTRVFKNYGKSVLWKNNALISEWVFAWIPFAPQTLWSSLLCLWSVFRALGHCSWPFYPFLFVCLFWYFWRSVFAIIILQTSASLSLSLSL